MIKASCFTLIPLLPPTQFIPQRQSLLIISVLVLTLVSSSLIMLTPILLSLSSLDSINSLLCIFLLSPSSQILIVF